MTTGRINQIAFFTVSSSHLTWTRTRHKNAFGFCVERGTAGARVGTKTGRKPLFALPFLLLSPISGRVFQFLGTTLHVFVQPESVRIIRSAPVSLTTAAVFPRSEDTQPQSGPAVTNCRQSNHRSHLRLSVRVKPASPPLPTRWGQTSLRFGHSRGRTCCEVWIGSRAIPGLSRVVLGRHLRSRLAYHNSSNHPRPRSIGEAVYSFRTACE